MGKQKIVRISFIERKLKLSVNWKYYINLELQDNIIYLFIKNTSEYRYILLSTKHLREVSNNFIVNSYYKCSLR